MPSGAASVRLTQLDPNPSAPPANSFDASRPQLSIITQQGGQSVVLLSVLTYYTAEANTKQRNSTHSLLKKKYICATLFVGQPVLFSRCCVVLVVLVLSDQTLSHQIMNNTDTQKMLLFLPHIYCQPQADQIK